MIDEARALLTQTYDRIATIDELLPRLSEERDRLAGLRDSLTAFIEQPGSVRSDMGSGPEGTPTPASKQGARAARGKPASRPRATGEPAADPVASPTTPPKEPSTGGDLACDFPGCRRDGFTSKQQLGSHRFQAHVRRAPKAAALEPPTNDDAKPDHPSRSEKFLCGRNCGASFLSREGVRRHEDEGTCRPKPTPPPSGLTPLSSLGGSTRSGGFGQ